MKYFVFIVLFSQTLIFGQTIGVSYYSELQNVREDDYEIAFREIANSNVSAAQSSDGKKIIFTSNRINKSYSVDIKKFIINKDVCSIRVIGYSPNKDYYWFLSSIDEYHAFFGRVNIRDSKIDIFKRPKNYASYQMLIEYSNGNAIYSDFPFQFDTLTAQETKISKEVFHLYRTNMINQKTNIIDTNIGVGFVLKRDLIGNLYYKKTEESQYIKVIF